MDRITGFDRFDALDATLDKNQSRRDMIKRLGALGLVAAGALARSPLAAAERGQDRGRAKDKDQPEDRGKDRGPGPAGKPHDPHPQRRRVGAAAVIVGSPQITNPFLSISAATNGVVTVTVTGTLAFSEFDVNQMKQGLKYAVTCKVMESDSTSADDFCFIYKTSGRNTSLIFPTNRTNPARTAALRFSQQVASSVLDQDDWLSGSTDEVYGLLLLWASTDGGATWIDLPDARTNEIRRSF